MKYLWTVFGLLFISAIAFTQKVDYYTLENGLTVIIDEVPDANQVYGSLVVNAGSKDEEENATGIAHYLEHMLFKGTETLGTADWESEKVIMAQINEQYDKLQTASSDDEIKAIQQKINGLSIESAKYIIPNEFSALIQEMGGVGLNAGTGKDLTYYHNSFPANQVEKWLNLYSHRMQKPVFRLFQSELETVYEEKNRASDNPFTAYSDQLFESLFDGHPYSRSIIGYTEHLKKPNMTAMREYFDNWYVPNNMALIISGNITSAELAPMIEETFGVLESKALLARKNPPIAPFDGTEVVKVKLTSLLQGEIAFRGAKVGSDDDVVLSVAANVLNNSGQYGLLDQLIVDGDVSSAFASNFTQKDGSVFLIDMVPVLDRSQGRQLSFKFTEKLIFEKLDQLKSGDFDDELLENAKRDILKNFTLSMESPQGRGNVFMRAFINGQSPDDIANYYSKINNVTKDDIISITNKYLGKDYLSFQSSKGKVEKENIEKPELKPIEAVQHAPSEYANFIYSIESEDPVYSTVDFAKDVTVTEFQDKVDLHYVKNDKNKIFNMTIKFGVGEVEFPLLKYAAPVMNRAGVLGQLTSNEVKTEFAKLGITYSFSYDDSYTYVNLLGEERNLAQAVSLLSKIMLLPSIEDKAFDAIVSNEVLSRIFAEKENVSLKSAALQEYLFYGDNSRYLDRIDSKELWNLRPTELVAKFQDAAAYEADIHYYGSYSLDDVLLILKTNLALASSRKPSKSPYNREITEYNENTIYLVDDKETRQAQVYLYQKGKPLSIEDRAVIDGLNQYIGGSFNGLMMKEIREYRALAYTASANVSTPINQNWDSFLVGYIGTQADKTNDVVEVVETLFSDLPAYEDRFSNLQSYLLNSTQMSRPSNRSLSRVVENWQTAGYNQDPNMVNLEYYKDLSFEEMMDYYNTNMKDSPIAIAILGDVKKIDTDAMERFGEVKKLNVSKLFTPASVKDIF